METQLIDGKALAARIREELREQVTRDGLSPCLATVLVGDDSASAVYVRMKTRDAEKVGIRVVDRKLEADVSQERLEAVLDELNRDEDVDGILLQLPVPPHLDTERLIGYIDPDKDVDGFHPVSLGRLLRGQPGFRPCTPAGVMALLDDTGFELEGAEAVVVGRSNIVGKPVSLMLLERNATVTVAHSRTADLPGTVREADVVIAAAGVAHLIEGDWLKPGAVVIDVGINRDDEGKLIGDVDTDAAMGTAAYITPVPGGVGPMTRIELMANTVLAHRRRRGLTG